MITDFDLWRDEVCPANVEPRAVDCAIELADYAIAEIAELTPGLVRDSHRAYKESVAAIVAAEALLARIKAVRKPRRAP